MMTKEAHDRIYGKEEPKSRLEAFLEELRDRVPNPYPTVRITDRKGVEFGLRWRF